MSEGWETSVSHPIEVSSDPVVEVCDSIKAKRRRLSRRQRAVAVVVTTLSVIALLGGGTMIVAPQLMHSGYDDLRVQALRQSDDAGDDENTDSVNGSSDDVDWDALEAVNGDVIGWVSVDNTAVSYPLAKGWDNDYYLYHDFWGNWDWNGCPFTDYRSDPNARHALCYGHNMYGGTMFGPLRDTFQQWYFDTIGDCHWTTPECGETVLHPLCAIYTDKWNETVQTFDFTPGGEDVQRRLDAIIASKELELNERVVGDASLDSLVRDSEETFLGSEKDRKTAYDAAELETYRTWLRAMLGQADAVAWDANNLIESSTRCVTLATCNSPYGGAPTRTLLVFVA